MVTLTGFFEADSQSPINFTLSYIKLPASPIDSWLMTAS